MLVHRFVAPLFVICALTLCTHTGLVNDSAVPETKLLSSRVGEVGRTMHLVRIVRGEINRHAISNYPVVVAVVISLVRAATHGAGL